MRQVANVVLTVFLAAALAMAQGNATGNDRNARKEEQFIFAKRSLRNFHNAAVH